MSEPQTSISEDISMQHSKVVSDEVVDVDEVEENLERELLDDNTEPSSADVYLLLQEMHSDIRSFKSRLDRVEKGQSKANSIDNNACDKELAPKHGGRKRKISEDGSDDESVLMNKILSNSADPASTSAENVATDTDNLLSNIAQ